MWWYKWVMMIRGCDGGGALPGTQKWMIMKERERGMCLFYFPLSFFLKLCIRAFMPFLGLSDNI